MAMESNFKPSVQGDGVNIAFFQQLWQKNRKEVRDSQSETYSSASNSDEQTPLRLPDTVTFQLGQPLQWFFTSERGGNPVILKKRRQNVNVEKVEEVFLEKARASNKGFLHENDIVAYFIASNECTLRNRRMTKQRTLDSESHDGTRPVGPELFAGQEEDSICDIEYFNEEALRDFLFGKRKNQSGILQRFIEPSGGGTHNSQIRAICTPKMCVLERRKTKQDLHDSRFGLYERAVTFEGAEVFSVPLPLRGEVLPRKLRLICERILDYVSKDLKSLKGYRSEIRMVIHLKLDSKERIWLLYSSSVRNVNSFHHSFPSISTMSHSVGEEETVLNLQNVIKFSPNIKLCQTANHDPYTRISNERSFTFCPSCGSVQCDETFHPVPYKTLVTHYEQVMALSGNQWPPSKDIIKSAGGVGFGTIKNHADDDGSKQAKDDEYIIPPVIRHFHKRLKAEGYLRYRADHLFLHKKCNLCENCFLSYANLVSTSFQIKMPLNLDTELKRLRSNSNKVKGSSSVKKSTHQRKTNASEILGTCNKIESFGSEILLPSPSLPSAIIEAPIEGNEEDLGQLMLLPYKTIESASQPLQHLIDTYKAVENSKINTDHNKVCNTKRMNPYEIPLTLNDSTNKKKKSKRHSSKKSISFNKPPLNEGILDHSKDDNLTKHNNEMQMLSNALRHYDDDRS